MVLLITIRESLRVHAECNEPLVVHANPFLPRPAATIREGASLAHLLFAAHQYGRDCVTLFCVHR